MRWTIERYPELDGPLRELARQHLELRHEPLHLALAFDPGRDPGDVFLLEVLGNFASNEIDPDKILFEAAMDGRIGLPLSDGQKLHLILTSPTELKCALEEAWPSAEEIRNAVNKGDFQVLYQDEIGREVLEFFHD